MEKDVVGKNLAMHVVVTKETSRQAVWITITARMVQAVTLATDNVVGVDEEGEDVPKVEEEVMVSKLTPIQYSYFNKQKFRL